ncbi:MAG: biotin/lipoyl-binding protein [Bacilli bacterium]|nr:biotin/lipoyl-binding protein [Bacilli bacterium]
MKIYKIKVNGKTYKVELQAMEEVKTGAAPTAVASKKKEAPKAAAPVSTGDGTPVLAPIQGQLLKFKVKVGDKVKKGDVLLLIEAMKLENEVCAPCDGVISELVATAGSMVTSKQLLLKIK